MNKEEAINKIIERYKSYVNKRFVNLVDCCGMDCEDCPFRGAQCADDVVMAIIDRFVKAEERSETNLEHYILDKRVDVHIRNEDEVWHLIFKVGTDDACYESGKRWTPIDWLLEPYKPPKLKLTQFEYDLLKCCDVHCCIYEFWLLDEMYRKGYFKGIPTDVPIGDILENCEVVEE